MTYEEALKTIAATKYGFQGIIEDYGHDTNAFNYHAYQYYSKLAEAYQFIAKKALNETKQQ